MHKAFFYWKLAYQNLRKNKQHYVPYMLTCIGTILMFYILCALTYGSTFNGQFNFGAETIRMLLQMGIWVVGIFAVLFLFYTFSFLIKRRKKEFALYNILGMGKGHISRLLLYETFYVALISFVLGIVGGILLSKAMTLLLYRLLRLAPVMGFEVPIKAIVITLVTFGAIFLLTYASALWQIHVANPVELLRGGQVGEKEPKANWLIALLGVITLGAGYYIAVTTTDPLAALMYFFVAVVLVIVGTYCLFTAGSVAGLKRNKRYYYKTKHFVPVSGMIYRMKQNVAGLASICILSTMLLVVISTTLSLYLGVDDAVKTSFPHKMLVADYTGEASMDEIRDGVDRALQKEGIQEENGIAYRSIELEAKSKAGVFTALTESEDWVDSCVVIVPFDDVADRLPDVEAPNGGQAVALIGGVPAIGDQVDLLGERLVITRKLGEMEGLMSRYTPRIGLNVYYVFVDDETFGRASDGYQAAGFTSPYNTVYEFDPVCDNDLHAELADAIMAEIPASRIDWQGNYQTQILSLFGGLFFLGILLSILFGMATVLIIYYKQLSEGYDDCERFEIMQKVGMSRAEVKKAINSQVLTVFFLPLVVAALHMIFAFPMISQLLRTLMLTNVGLFALITVCAVVVFGALYALVYMVTARVYYKIVAPGA